MPASGPHADLLLDALLDGMGGVSVYALDDRLRYLAFNEGHRRRSHAPVEIGLEATASPEERDRLERVLGGEALAHDGARYAPIRDRDGIVIGVAVVRRDLAEQRRQLQAHKLESLGVMAAGIVHEFNNLLVGILGNAELALADLPPGTPGREKVAGIERSAAEAARLTDQLLAYAGQVPPEVARCDVVELVEETAAALRASLAPTLQLELDLKPVSRVQCDRRQIQQVLLNLVSNAVEAIGEGSGMVRITLSEREIGAADLKRGWVDDDLPAGTYVSLAVEDTGPGVEEAVRARLFDPFFSTKSTGRGLGLASVLGIVRNHHGSIVVSSAPHGSRFEVLLPALVQPAAPRLEVTPDAPSAIVGDTVLIIDDEPRVRQVAGEILARGGYRILEAGDGLDGIDALDEHRERIGVVLLDMTMPRLDGEAAFRRLRELVPDLPVVVMSGWTREHRRLSFLADADRVVFLQKPFRVAALREAVREVTR